MDRHLENTQLEPFLLGKLSAETTHTLGQHVRACEQCLYAARAENRRLNTRQEVAPEVLGLASTRELLDLAGRETFRRLDAWQAVLEGERALALHLASELLQRPPGLRRSVIASTPRYQLWGLTEHFRDEARNLAPRDLVLAREYAELGVEVARRLDPHLYEAAASVIELALAMAVEGDMLRLSGELRRAERCFAEAQARLQGTRWITHRERLEFLSLLASLRIDQGRVEEAQRLIRKALRDAREGSAPASLRAELYLQLATAEGRADRPGAAVRCCRQVLRYLRFDPDPGFELLAQTHRAHWMVEAGSPWDAFTVFEKSRWLRPLVLDPEGVEIHRRAVEGRVLRGIGDLANARAAFEDVRRLSAERGLRFEQALATVELSAVLVLADDSTSLPNLARSVAPCLASQELHPPVLAALADWVTRCAAGAPELRWLDRLSRFLVLARNQPEEWLPAAERGSQAPA